MNKLQKLRQLLSEIEPDYNIVFRSGSVRAGRRLRKQVKQAKQLLDEIRKDSLNITPDLTKDE